MASSRKKFGKPEPATRIKILPAEEPGPETSGPQGTKQASSRPAQAGTDIEALAPANVNSNEPLARRLAKHLQENPEQVKRLFASWVEEEEN